MMRAKPSFTLFILLTLMAILASGCSSPPTDTPQAQNTPEQTAAPETATTGPEAPPESSPPTPVPTSAVSVALQYIEPIKDRALARVNGDEIFWEDFEPSLYQALRTVSRQGNVNWNDPAMQQRLGQLENEVLKQTVDRWLVRQMAEEQGIVVTQDQVEAEIEKEKAKILESGYYEDWEGYLAASGFTASSVKQAAYDTLLLMALIKVQEVDGQAEQVHLAHIVTTNPEAAQTVVDKLKAGADFAEVASEYSDDEQTRDSGGDLGWFPYEFMLPELARQARVIPVGQFSDPILTQYGYTIIMILDRQMLDADPTLLQQRQQSAMMVQLEQKRAEAEIEYLVDFAEEQN